MAWGKSEWTVLKTAGHCTHIDDLSWSPNLCILPAACLQCVQDCGNMACMFYNLVYSHMIFYDPGCSYRIFLWCCICLYNLRCSPMILYVFHMTFFRVIWFHVCVCFLYIHLWSCMCLYDALVCSYMFFYDHIRCSMILYILCCYCLFFMILYILWCSLDVFLWYCMLLFVLMIIFYDDVCSYILQWPCFLSLFIWSSIILHVICLYILFMSCFHMFSYVLTYAFTCSWVNSLPFPIMIYSILMTSMSLTF